MASSILSKEQYSADKSAPAYWKSREDTMPKSKPPRGTEHNRQL